MATLLVLHPTSAFAPSGRSSPARSVDTRLYKNLPIVDSVQSMFKNFGKSVEVSHILIGPQMTQEDARAKLEEVKAEINDDLSKFEEMAAEVRRIVCWFASEPCCY